MRWPKGVICPECGGSKHSVIKTRALAQCFSCRSQNFTHLRERYSIPPGYCRNYGFGRFTVYRRAKAAPLAWNLPAALALPETRPGRWHTSLCRSCTHKKPDNAPPAKWKWMTPLAAANARANADALSPERFPLWRGVATTDDGTPHQSKLLPVFGVTVKAIARRASGLLIGECQVFTERLRCFTAVANRGSCAHAASDKRQQAYARTAHANGSLPCPATAKAPLPAHMEPSQARMPLAVFPQLPPASIADAPWRIWLRNLPLLPLKLRPCHIGC